MIPSISFPILGGQQLLLYIEFFTTNFQKYNSAAIVITETTYREDATKAEMSLYTLLQ